MIIAQAEPPLCWLEEKIMIAFFWGQKPDVAQSITRAQKPVAIIQKLGRAQAIVLITR